MQKNNIIITNKTSDFNFLARPDIAKKGPQPGVITAIVQVVGMENGKPFKHVNIDVELDAKDRAGNHFTLTKAYNVAENGRGIVLFLKDYNALNNTQLGKADLYDLDPQSLKGVHVVAEVEYSEVGNKIVAIIKSFSSEQNAAAAQNIAAVAEVALV